MRRLAIILIAANLLAACNLSVPQVTPTVAPSRTPSNTPEATASNTPDATLIAQLLATDTPTATATPTITRTPTSTATPTVTDTATLTATPTASNTAVPSATATATATDTLTPTLMTTPTATQTPSLTPSQSPTPTDTATSTPTPLPTATDTPRPSVTPLPTLGPSDTPTITPSATPTATTTPLPSETPTASNTPRPSATPTDVPTATTTPLPSETPTASDTPRPSATATRTLAPDEIAQLLSTPLVTWTPLPSPSPTNTITPPTQDVTPTFITATPGTPPVDGPPVLVTTTPVLVTDTPQPTLTSPPTTLPTNLPVLPPPDPRSRAFVLGEGGESATIPLLPDVVLFERNPQNPAQYVMTNSVGQLYFTGLDGANAWRVQESPFSQFEPRSREENNAYVQDITWSPDGQFLAFLVNADLLAGDGVWYFSPGQFPPIQLLVDCPQQGHPGCGIVLDPNGVGHWESMALEWSPDSNAVLVRTRLPSENRVGLTVLSLAANRSERPPVIRYEYGSWENNGNRILVSGSAPDGNVYIAWINRDGSFSDMVFNARDQYSLWVQNAVQRPDGSVVTLGAPYSEGGPGGTMRIYNMAGIALTGPIGNGPPQRVEWSPDRSAVLVISGGRVYLANINGTVTDITDEVGGAQAINWVSGSVPRVDNPDAAPPQPVGVRETTELPYPAGTRLRVLASDGIFIRSQPNVNAQLVASVLAGGLVDMLPGPPVHDGRYIWWEVRSVQDGISGWIAAEIDGERTVGP